MYLVISDYRLSMNSKDFYRRNDWLEEIRKHYPQYIDVQMDDIEEILVYSSKKDDAALFARTVECADYTADENTLRIGYGDITSDSEINCAFVKKNVYALLRRKGLLKNGEYAPPVLYLDSIQDYKYIRNGPQKTVTAQNLLNQLAVLLEDNDWIGIVKACPRMDKIEQNEIWYDPECLSKLAFALSKLATRTKKNPSSQDIQRKKENTEFFLKVSERCIELEPFSSMHKSTLAYFLYDRYKADYNEEDFNWAKKLYEDLIETSFHNFKERYRYANLLRKHYEKPENLYQTDSYKEFNRVIAQYDQLIEEYDQLEEKVRKNQKNNYRKALYQYVNLQYDKTFSRYWDVFFDNRLYGTEIPDYLINGYAADMIKKCDDYIHIVEGLIPEKPTAENINDKPGYLDVYYRDAQLAMAKAFLLRLRNFPTERYMLYFEEAEKKLRTLLKQAGELKEQGVHFVFPHYMKPILAVCCYLEGKPEESMKCFGLKDQPWIQFEKARILLLNGETDNAIELLERIPSKDLCRRKADDLLAKLNEKV